MKLFITWSSVDDDDNSGDFSDHGFWEPGGWHWSLPAGQCDKEDMSIPLDESRPIEDAVEVIRAMGCTEWGGAYWSTPDAYCDYQSGTSIRYCAHIEGVTPSTLLRIRRLVEA